MIAPECPQCGFGSRSIIGAQLPRGGRAGLGLARTFKPSGEEAKVREALCP